MPDVQLTVNGTDYGGWKSMRLARGIEQLAGTFELGVSELWPGQQIIKSIAPMDKCAVKIDDTTVITGHVDDVAVRYNANDHEVAVRGRDATGDLVDCSAFFKNTQWTTAKGDAIVREICAPFGIKVTVDSGSTATAIVDAMQLGLAGGETVWEVLDRLAKLKAFLPMSDGQGGLLITSAGRGGRVPHRLERGVNILEARLEFSFRERFSKYTVKGQGPMSDFAWDQSTRLKAEATDEAVSRYRHLMIVADDSNDGAQLKRRALWEANTRRAKSAQIAVKVQGWSHPSGVWQPNTLVHVVDPWLRTDAELLVKGVQFTLDESGSFTELAMVLPEAFALIPLPKKPADIWNTLQNK